MMTSTQRPLDLESAWNESVKKIQSINRDSTRNSLESLVSITRAWTRIESHFNSPSLAPTNELSSTPPDVLEALQLLSLAGQKKAVTDWYLTCLEKQLPQTLQLHLSPLSHSYQSTSTSSKNSIKTTCRSIVSDLERCLSPMKQGLFGTSKDIASLLRLYQTILHSTISRTPNFQISLLQHLDKEFLLSPSSSIDSESSQLIQDLVTLGLSSFLSMQLNEVAHAKIKARVIWVADDGTWKSLNPNFSPGIALYSSDFSCSRAMDDEEEGELAGIEGGALESLRNWLDQKLIRSLRSWLEVVERSLKVERSSDRRRDEIEVDSQEEVDLESGRSKLESREGEDQRDKGMEYYMLKTLCEVRSAQLFDLVADWPESTLALLDLKECLTHSELKSSVTKTYSNALRTRLLHSGAATQDIIQIYVHTIRSLREIDPSGVILSLVVSPIRNYLRGRKDTIVVIVSGLIGEGESTLLRQELEGGINSASAGIGALDSNEDAAKSAGIKSGIDDEDEDYDEEDEGPPNWNDENWEPRPTDAGPNFNQSKSEDIINILITIFDDRLGFVKALEQTTAEQLIKIRGYDSSREYKNNVILKSRFGSDAIGHCDVMLSDVTASRRIDLNIHNLATTALKSHHPAPPLPLPHPSALSTNQQHALDSLHPIIISRQFWPEVQGAENPNSYASKSEFQKIGSAIGIGSGPGSDGLKMPGQFNKAMEVYEKYYSNVKDTRKLKWLANVGRVQVELEMDDGRIINEEVTPLQAAVIELASEGSASQSNPLSAVAAAQALNVERSAALNALYFWSAKQVLRELESSPGSFEIRENLEKDEDQEMKEEEVQ